MRDLKKVTPKILSAGMVPVLRGKDGQPNRFLLLRAFRHWDFPKGVVEAGEDSLLAAIRELEEETGIETPRFTWGKDFEETEVYGTGKIARYYVGEITSAEVVLPVNPELGFPEHHEFQWLTYEEAKPLLIPRVIAILDWAKEVAENRPAQDEPS